MAWMEGPVNVYLQRLLLTAWRGKSSQNGDSLHSAYDQLFWWLKHRALDSTRSAITGEPAGPL